jgi:hypothetical protein
MLGAGSGLHRAIAWARMGKHSKRFCSALTRKPYARLMRIPNIPVLTTALRTSKWRFLLNLPSSVMSKNKKKHSKKDDISEDILDAAALSVKKFRKVTKEIGKLSTVQKLLGGAALVAAGLIFLSQQDFDGEGNSGEQKGKLGEGKTDDSAATYAEEAEAPAKTSSAPRKSRKGVKSEKAHASSAKKAADESDDY